MADTAEDIYEFSGLIRMYQETGEMKYRQAADAAFLRLESGEDELSELAMPFYAEYDTLFMQKAHYGKIAAFFEAKETWSGRDAAALIDTIEKMSMEIYEYYRALCDLFKWVVRSQGWLEKHSPAPQDGELAGYAVLKACSMGVLNSEKYEAEGLRLQKRSVMQQEESGEGGCGRRDSGREEDISKDRRADSTGSGKKIKELKVICLTARSATLETDAGQIYQFDTPGEVYVNGTLHKTTDRVIFSLFGLKPDTEYEVCLKRDGEEAAVCFRTDYEFVTLNVKDTGAKGDGIQDDTGFIQAAVLACPRNGRVLIPEGTYRITSLFLKSHIRLELGAGAVLAADTDRSKYPKFPGMIESCDESGDYNLGTWEGNPLPMFAGIISGIEVEDVVIYGEGLIDGRASFDNWWDDVKTMRGAFRPRMVFLERCRGITLQGFRLKNSPTWVLHPYFSQGLRFLDLDIENPADSPNTDGLDPESCRDVEIAGLHFSLGDDCIAVKSGKIYMGRRYQTPSENIEIRQCLMENGHGAVTVGSEVGAGVKSVHVKDCLFRHTDRGLRVKTRRGRGKDSVLEDITFDHIVMEHVMTPFVVNSFYFCDPDGRSEYVQSREALPVDDRTPEIRDLAFTNIKASDCHVAASFLCGLPEQKIRRIELENVDISFADDARAGVPAMMEGVEPCSKQGFTVMNVDTLVCRNVTISGQAGEALIADNINHFENEEEVRCR